MPETAEAAGTRRRTGAVRRCLPYAGLVIGAWATVAPYAGLGSDLNAEASKEFADHVVPGVVVIMLSAVTLLQRRRRAPGGMFPLVAGFGVVLGGLWMTATHLPLVSQARDGIVSDGVAAWHSVPGVVVMALGAAWAAVHWSDADEGSPGQAPPSPDRDEDGGSL